MPQRKRLLAVLVGLLTLALVTLGFGLALNQTSPSLAAGEPGSPAAPADEAKESGDTELATLAVPGDDESDDGSSETPSGPPAANAPEDEAEEEDPDSGTQLETLPADNAAPIVSWQLKPPALVQAGAVVHIRPINQGEPDGSIIDKSIYLDGNLIGNVVSAHRNYDFQLDTTGLQDGVHVLRAVSKDAAGNTGFAVVAFVVDGTAPSLMWQVQPAAVVTGVVPVRFAILDEAPGIFDKRYVLDGVEIATFVTDHYNFDYDLDTTGLAEGEHTLVGVAYDEAGNRSETTPVTFVVDRTGPSIEVKTAAPASVGGPNYYANLSLKLFDAGQVDKAVINGVTKQLSNDAWSDVNFLTIGAFGIQDGVPFTVVAYDVAGNSTTRTFILDGTAPTVGWQLAPDAVESGDVHWRFVVTGEPAQIFDKQLFIDGVLFDRYVSDHFNRDIHFDSSVLSEGVHTAQGVIYDEAGNVGSTSLITFRVDRTGPTVTVKAAPDSVGTGPVGYRSLSLKLYDVGQIDYVEINGVKKDLTNNQWSDVNGLNLGQFGIVDGVDFTVVAYDVAGNSTTRTFRIDHTAPALGWQVAPKPIEHGTTTDWLAVLIDGHLEPSGLFTWSYVVDGTPVLTDTRPNWGYNYSFDTTTVADGLHTVYAQACDEAGNCGVSSTLTFRTDNTGPTATPKSGSWDSPVWREVSFKLYDAVGIDYVTVNGVKKDLTNSVWSDLNFVTPGAFGAVEGGNTLVVTDVSGNSTTYSFRLDTIAPTVGWQVFQPKADRPGFTDWLWVVTNEPDGTFDKRYYLVAPGQAPQLLSQIVSTHFNFNYELNAAKLADGTYQVYGVAIDQAGNSAQTDSRSFTIANGVWVS